MRNKIFRSLIFVSVMVLLLTSIISIAFLQNDFNKEQTDKLYVELNLATNAVNKLGIEYLEGINDDTYRFTVIDADGNVEYDTRAEAKGLENHADREEIIEALQFGRGSSARYSSTLTEKTFYEAVRLDNGMVLRVSVSQLTMGGTFLRVLPMIAVMAAMAILLSFLVSGRMANKITEPLLVLDLDNPTENNTYEELSPVLSKIHNQRKQLGRQMSELNQKNDEISQIISSMSEGLVILDEQGIVISMNSSARRIFGVKKDAVGTDFLTLDRSPELNQAIAIAGEKGRAETVLNKNGLEYRFNISRIESDGVAIGTLILGFDITEQAFAERNRREFTANVSHELKTPLQSIIGSAELLETGLVKPKDTSRFVGNIKNEAMQLVNLINDIIRLSQLDERAEQARETVGLIDVAKEAVRVLTPSAVKKNVKLSVSGENIQVNGVYRYIYEVIYNLCDNAIRYNKDGGSVDISVKEKDNNAVVAVSDTGIGIPAEHQARIFERFYRVDKSHSKETGGTGLGLSIVKHAVMLHDGKVELKSRVGEGTTIKVILPQKVN